MGFFLWLGREKGARNGELEHAHAGVCSSGQRGISRVLEPSRRILCVTSRDFGSHHHLLVLCVPHSPDSISVGMRPCFDPARPMCSGRVQLISHSCPGLRMNIGLVVISQAGWGPCWGTEGTPWPGVTVVAVSIFGQSTGTVTDLHSCQHLWPLVTASVAATGPRPCWGLCAGPRGWCCWECTAGWFWGWKHREVGGR